ncbi:hypothetical protein N665_0871s0006 [Sinapis alba]|nr:hypothetical protein N665_0871s0006 [Sinapis alba]
MDLEIVGRHALFFDDDSMATFVNSPTALVDWNSLFIDRYDVRHLLSSLPPPRPKRRRPVSDDPDLDADLDHERYLDLPAESPSPSPSNDESDINDGSASTNADGFRAVPYSYGCSSDFSDQKIADMESGFNPPFPVPDYLLQHLPPTEKLHQIMARTSSFVSNHGGQSEIVLRVKQGGNPTFGFLMPDHHLHPYFRFLVEHQELLTGKSVVGDKKVEGEKDGGALSLLGSVYGTVEDEDTKEESARVCKTNESAEADSSGPEGSKEAAKVATVRDGASKHSLPLNDQASFIKRNPSVSAVNVVERKQINTEDNVTDKPFASEKLKSSTMLAQPKNEQQIVEPPIEMKRAIDRIVDFIQKNGKELEATLAAQDVKYGMFPFLRPASLYHAYYRKVLQEAEELKSCNKGDFTKKKDIKQEKMDSAVKDEKSALGSVLQDDSAEREKQKMVSDKSKIELQKEPFKPVEPQMRVNVDVNTAAAILEAARRGIRNPQLGILSGKPLDETSQSLGNDGSSTSSKPPDLAKSMGQLVSSSAAASEADSSEAGLTKEQKLKAERLKRAKMFVAMLKPGAQASQQAESSRSLSVEPLASVSVPNAAKEIESSSLPSEADETKQADDGNSERRSKRNYRSRSQRDEDGDNEESSMEEVTEDTKIEKKHSSKKRHDRHKHKTRHSSKDRHSRDKHKHESSSDDEYHSRSRYRHKHRKSSDRHELYDSSDNECEHRHRSSKHSKDTDYSKDKRSHHNKSRKHHDKHLGSSDDEHHRHHRHRSSRRKHEESSDGEHGHRQKSSKRIKKDEKRVEEEESVSKSDQSDRKASPEDSNIMHPQNEPTQVSDELRAKIRAMLADTL